MKRERERGGWLGAAIILLLACSQADGAGPLSLQEAVERAPTIPS
jgi:hypothetical protein